MGNWNTGGGYGGSAGDFDDSYNAAMGYDGGGGNDNNDSSPAPVATPNYSYTRPDGIEVVDYSISASQNPLNTYNFSTGVPSPNLGGGGNDVARSVLSQSVVQPDPVSYPGASSIPAVNALTRSYSDIKGLVTDALSQMPSDILSGSASQTTAPSSTTGISGLASRARDAVLAPAQNPLNTISGAISSGIQSLKNFSLPAFGGEINLDALPGGGFGLQYFRQFNQGGEVSNDGPRVNGGIQSLGYYNAGGPAVSRDEETSDVAMEARKAYLPQSVLDNITMTDSGIMSTMEGLRESNPEAFAEMMRRNTEKEIERLNMLEYYDDEILAKSGDPVLDRYLIDEAVYRTAVAPGFERTNDMEPYVEGSVTGGVTTNARFLSPGYTPRSLVPGDEMSATNVLHETVHDILPRSREGILGAANKEEAAVIGLDLYKAFKAGNKEGFNNALNYLSSNNVGVVLADPFAFDDMRENLTGTIEYLYEQSGNPMNAEQKQALDSEVYSILKKGAQEQFRMQYEGRR